MACKLGVPLICGTDITIMYYCGVQLPYILHIINILMFNEHCSSIGRCPITYCYHNMLTSNDIANPICNLPSSIFICNTYIIYYLYIFLCIIFIHIAMGKRKWKDRLYFPN